MTRKLKVESDGDFFRRRITPRIRLKGQWLQAAGFVPGGRVEVRQTGAGVLELRFQEPLPDGSA